MYIIRVMDSTCARTFIFVTVACFASAGAASNVCSKPMTMTAMNGSIQSPGYPSRYPNDVECVYKIEGPVGYFVEILFKNIKLVGYDYIQISEIDPYPKKYYKGEPTVPTQYISRISRVEIRLITDGTLSSSGFSAKYTIRSKSDVCFRRILTDETGTIESPLYPSLYPPNAACDYRIVAKKDHFIELKFTYFQMQDREGKLRDYLTIRDGKERGLQYFGTHKTPFKITSNTNTLRLRFVSDGSFEYGGFHAEYKVMHNSMRCTRKVMRKMSGSFTSPGYPDNYPVDADCEFIIEVDIAYHVVITFHDFDLDPPPLLFKPRENMHGDYLESWQIVEEIVNVEQNIVLYKNEHTMLQGKQYTPFKFAPRRNRVELRFVADEKGTSRGFNATYEAFESMYCGANYAFLYVLNGHMECEFGEVFGYVQRCHIACDENYVLVGRATVECDGPAHSPACVLDPNIFGLCARDIRDPKCPFRPGHVAQYFTDNRARIPDQKADKTKFPKNLLSVPNLVTFAPRETINGLECGKHFCSLNSETGKFDIHCKSYAEKLMKRLKSSRNWSDAEHRKLQMHYCFECQKLNCGKIPEIRGRED